MQMQLNSATCTFSIISRRDSEDSVIDENAAPSEERETEGGEKMKVKIKKKSKSKINEKKRKNKFCLFRD